MSRGNSSFWDSLIIDNRDNHIEKQALADYERNRQSNNDKPSAGGRERADDEQHVRSDYKPGTDHNDGKNNGNNGNGSNGNNGNGGTGNNGNGNSGNDNNGNGGNTGGSKNDDDLESTTTDDVNEVTPGDDVNDGEESDGTEDSEEGEDGGEDDGMSM